MENKEKLLTCARDLFYARGYDAVGIQEIVDAAGVTKPTMYYYFGSKKGLLEELMRRIFDELQGQMEQAAIRREEDRFPDILYRVADTFLHYAVSHEKEYRFALALYYTGEENEGHLVVKPLIGRYYSRLVQIFAEAADELGNMHGRQKQFALGLQGILDTSFLLYCNQPKEEREEFTDDRIRSILQQFMYGIYS